MADLSWEDILKGIMGGVGAYAGYQAGGPNTTTSQVQMDPEVKGQWQAYRDFANQVANRPYTNTIAPFTQDQYGAMDQIRNLSGGGAEQQAGSQALQAFLSGGQQNPYMGLNNPFFNSVLGKMNDETMNRMDTAAFNSGSFGNSGVATQAADAVAQNAGNLGYQQYQNSANLAENALNRTASMVPQALGYQNQGLNNASAMLQSGAMQQNLGQQMMNNWWQYPMQQLSIMGQPLGFNMGSTSSQTNQGNPWASALGGGMLGLNFGNWFNQQPTTKPYTTGGNIWAGMGYGG